LRNKVSIFIFFTLFCTVLKGQINTYSPYSRYGLGELVPTTFAHNIGMGGAYIALKPDSIMPLFINVGNPAALSLVRLTTLEVGGNYHYSEFTGANSTLKKWNANFSYAALAFPVRSKGGAAFGIMPYSNVGYELQSITDAANIGPVKNLYYGDGGLNKAFLGYGVMPFKDRITKFRKKNLYVADSLKRFSGTSYRFRAGIAKILSDFSIGVNANYIFGSIHQVSKVVYPNSLLYNNTYRERTASVGDFTGNFGIQTAITKDSTARNGEGKRRAMKERVKITFGAFVALNNALKATYTAASYNYILNGFGDEIFRDTVLYKAQEKGKVKLPLEIGFGIGFKKGERLNLVADAALTNWSNFKFLDNTDTYYDSYRVALGMNYVPEKYSAGRGALIRKINYRLGANYQTGFIQLGNNGLVSTYALTAGIGLPVGIGRMNSMVNISAQYGTTAPSSGTGVRENFWRISFGFNFSDRWFNKIRED
jgi:hypothetical protein